MGNETKNEVKSYEELIKEAKDMGPEKFVVKFIRHKRGRINPRNDQPFMGSHVVFDGLNDWLRKIWPDRSPREITTELEKKGVIVMRPAKGGATAYVKGEEYIWKPATVSKVATKTASDKATAELAGIVAKK